MGFSSSGPSVTQPTKGKKGTIRTHSQPSQPVESASCGRTTMVDHENHVEGTSENQVNVEQSTFGFPVADPDTQVQMKNISPSALPHFYNKVHEDADPFLFEFDILCRS